MEPAPITFVYPFNGQCALNFDYDGKEYRVCWAGDWRRPPDLSRFPHTTNFNVRELPHSEDEKEVWASSKVIAYGADSHVREFLDPCDFPLCKIAIDHRQRQLLQKEFDILCHLSSCGAPVVHTCTEPLLDENGMFGFKMQRLQNIEYRNLAVLKIELEEAIKQVHGAGIIHGDISPSNILQNSHGRITLIDFGRAGVLGEHVSQEHMRFREQHFENYTKTMDYEKMEQTIGMTP
ncbi:serine/threonine kinase family protein [Apiospora kogelbergensis]|uniref:Serine/threonine kinase family protein n=1 Tax=Apiospora kogelbergensis TaxID=1337665 RepID=A0AAW0R2C0_9PEZI